jgi:hypothetical protein
VDRGPSDRNDDIEFQRNELSRKSRKSVEFAFCKSVFNSEVLTFDVTQVPKALMQWLKADGKRWR